MFACLGLCLLHVVIFVLFGLRLVCGFVDLVMIAAVLCLFIVLFDLLFNCCFAVFVFVCFVFRFIVVLFVSCNYGRIDCGCVFCFGFIVYGVLFIIVLVDVLGDNVWFVRFSCITGYLIALGWLGWIVVAFIAGCG